MVGLSSIHNVFLDVRFVSALCFWEFRYCYLMPLAAAVLICHEGSCMSVWRLVIQSSLQRLDGCSSVLILQGRVGAQGAEPFWGTMMMYRGGRFVSVVIRCHCTPRCSLLYPNTFSGILVWMYRGEMEEIGHGTSLETIKPCVIYDFLHGYPPIFYCNPQLSKKNESHWSHPPHECKFLFMASSWMVLALFKL